MSIRTHILGPLISILVLGCGDRTVELTAAVEEASVQVEQLTLGTRLLGSFELVLFLGRFSPESTSVSVETFSLVRASDQSTVVSPFEAVAQSELPVLVEPDQTKRITFVLDDQSLRPAEDIDAICAGPLQVIGVVSDSFTESNTSLTSDPFDATGCP